VTGASQQSWLVLTEGADRRLRLPVRNPGGGTSLVL